MWFIYKQLPKFGSCPLPLSDIGQKRIIKPVTQIIFLFEDFENIFPYSKLLQFISNKFYSLKRATNISELFTDRPRYLTRHLLLPDSNIVISCQTLLVVFIVWHFTHWCSWQFGYRQLFTMGNKSYGWRYIRIDKVVLIVNFFISRNTH